MNQHYITIIIIGGLILLSVSRRIKKNIGWQPLNKGGLMTRAVIFLTIGLIFSIIGGFHTISIVSDITGILIGALLAYVSGGTTQFERKDGKWFYRSNKWIGSIVIGLFFVRLIYRVFDLSTINHNEIRPFQSIGYTIGNSWTSGFYLIMFAYYVIYYFYLLRRNKQQTKLEKNITNM